MNIIELLEKIYNVHGLVIVLKDALWNLSDIPASVQREFTGILALIESIEKEITEVKNIFDEAVEIN